MNDNATQAAEAALGDARGMLDALMERHRSAAIPAILTACVSWSVKHGAAQLIFNALVRTSHLVPQAEKAWKEGLS